MNAGDCTEININHPLVGTVVLYPKAQESGTYDIGGVRTADSDDNVDGGGRPIDPKQRRRWSWEGTISWDPTGQDELEILESIASSSERAEVTITHISGDVRKGRGTVVGDIQSDSQAGTIGVKFSGGGRMKKVA